ncbi:cupin-like domain-containing protein [Chaetomidium leptoderma]|uniref:Cupin-like domain-containing protein n=1 Tax=Chaetomidium leptoderma TaxID=669021 RepID=A0AAN6VKA4_9PEZI|nr:cupin-like domain-containing protein [Chaetomidium leptoderma]
MADPEIQDPIAELITNYNELNSSVIEELDEEPSALEFMRFVARNTPFVVRGAAADWQATRTWTVDYLKDVLGDEPVNVAVTPRGNADAPTPYTSPDGTTTTLVFAKPHEEDQPFSAFLSHLTSTPQKEVRYAQTQNDNLRHGEYHPLFHHVPPTIPWARLALGQEQPDAVNLWIGNARSVTALHKDNYENVYVQVAGHKHFVLLPPAGGAAAVVNEQPLSAARYVRTHTLEGEEEGLEGGLELVLDDGEEGKGEVVPFAIWDPNRPAENATRYSALAQPMRVTLDPGDMLYLPCMWYHKVSQSCSPEGVCIAVNYWYDMDFAGPLYPLSTFVRSVVNKET